MTILQALDINHIRSEELKEITVAAANNELVSDQLLYLAEKVTNGKELAFCCFTLGYSTAQADENPLYEALKAFDEAKARATNDPTSNISKN